MKNNWRNGILLAIALGVSVHHTNLFANDYSDAAYKSEDVESIPSRGAVLGLSGLGFVLIFGGRLIRMACRRR